MLKIILILVAGLLTIMVSFLILLILSELWLRAVGLKSVAIIVRNLRRHPTRTALTYLATYVLVLVVTLIWSVLHFLDELYREKDRDFKAVVTSKYVMPSQMPYRYGKD